MIQTKDNTNNNNTGYLKIIVGCMFSGKTTELIKEYHKYKSCGYKCLFINSKLDNRYTTSLSRDDTTISHDGQMIHSINIDDQLFDYFFINNNTINIVKYDVIFINEGQFFNDLYKFTNYIVNTLNKRVYVCGLDGDYQRKKFGCLLDIIPICDDVLKLYALCGVCKINNGIFTHRRICNKKDDEQIVIGSDELYIPLCRKCYNEQNKNLLLVYDTTVNNTIDDQLHSSAKVQQQPILNNNITTPPPKSTSPSSVVVSTTYY